MLPDSEKIYDMLVEAVRPPEEEKEELVLVEVLNWSNESDWDSLAAERLHYAGFSTEILPSTKDDANNTMLYVFSESPNDHVTEALLDVLGLSEDRLIDDQQAGSEAAYRLVLGNDYDPCFNPTSP